MAATKGTSVTIASGNTTSGAFDIKTTSPHARIIGFVMPSAFTGASISFQVSADDSTYQDLYDSDNNKVSITVSASRTYGLKDDLAKVLGPWRFIKIVSASSEGATRTIVVVTK